MSRTGTNIYKRKDGRWEARYIKYYDENGKAKYGYVYAKTYKEVKAKQEYAISHRDQRNRKTRCIYYKDIVNEWLFHQKRIVKESSYARYCHICEKHIIPYLGQYELSKISSLQLEHFIQFLLNEGRIDKKGGLSKKTTSDIIVVIKAIFDYAKVNQYDVNCHYEHLSIKKEKKEKSVLSLPDQRKLQEALISHLNDLNLGILICLYTGLRIGEICALKWEDIYLEEKVIHIKSTLQRIQTTGASNKTRIIISTPKSSNSTRKIPIPECLHPLLKEYQKNNDAYVLTGEKEKFMEPRLLQYQFKNLLKELNIDYISFHGLRHTFATRCIELGFETKSLSEILGHATVNITLNQYVHSSLQLKYEQMQKLNVL